MENTLDITTPEEILLAGRERHQRFLQRLPAEYRMVGLSLNRPLSKHNQIILY